MPRLCSESIITAMPTAMNFCGFFGVPLATAMHFCRIKEGFARLARIFARMLEVILRSSWRCSIRRSTTGHLPSISAGDFDQKIKAKMVFYMRFSWKSRVYKAVFWVNIVRTRDIVLLPIEHLPEVSLRVWFFRICHVKGCDPSAVFGDCSVTSKEETLASSAVVVSFPVTGTRSVVFPVTRMRSARPFWWKSQLSWINQTWTKRNTTLGFRV